MASFVVMEAPAGRNDAAYVRDGFHFFAFLVPPLWLAWHRLWIEALVALAAMAVLGALGTVSGFAEASPLLSLLVSIYVGLEAPALRIAALRRRGWREWGVVDADDWHDAELKHLAGADGDAEDSVSTTSEPPAPAYAYPPRPAPSGPALGLFSYPGTR